MSGQRRTNLAKIRSFQFNITAAGTPEQLVIKQIASTIAFNNNGQAKDTITDSAKAFFTAGLRTGDVITISGALNAGNNATFVIDTISTDGGTITLTKNNVLTAEVAGNSVKIIAPITVPEGISLTVKGKHANTLKIYVGDGRLNALGHQCFTLLSDATLFLQVTRTDAIWLDADVSAEGVEVITEENKQGAEL